MLAISNPKLKAYRSPFKCALDRLLFVQKQWGREKVQHPLQDYARAKADAFEAEGIKLAIEVARIETYGSAGFLAAMVSLGLGAEWGGNTDLLGAAVGGAVISVTSFLNALRAQAGRYSLMSAGWNEAMLDPSQPLDLSAAMRQYQWATRFEWTGIAAISAAFAFAGFYVESLISGQATVT